MHVRSAVLLAVQHRRPGVLVRLHARPGDLLELLQRPLDLLPRRRVLLRPGDHPGFVRVLELQRIGHRRHLVRVAPQHLDLLALRAQVVALPQQVLGRFRGAAGAVAEELNQHRRSCAARQARVGWPPDGPAPAPYRRCPCRCSPSARSGSRWRRFSPPPTSARCSSAASAVHTRVLRMARRSSSDVVSPAICALLRHFSASSSVVLTWSTARRLGGSWAGMGGGARGRPLRGSALPQQRLGDRRGRGAPSPASMYHID